MDFISGIGSSIGSMFGGGGATPAAAPVEAMDAGPIALTGGGSLPAMTPQTSTAPAVSGTGNVAGGFNPLSLIGPAASLIPSVIGLAGGKGGGTDKAIKQARNATGQLAQAGGQSLNAYQTGALQPMQQALIDRQKQIEEAALQQYAAKAGIPVSTFVAQSQGDIAGHMAALENQMYQQNFANAYQAIGANQNNLINIAKMEAEQDAAQRQQWAAFMKALGGLGTTPGIFGNT